MDAGGTVNMADKSAPVPDVVVVGAGGNIGSHLVPHLARMQGVQKVVLIDKDTYERKNLTSQDITPRDVGQAKARVQARRLRRIDPTLSVVAYTTEVEALPLSALRARAILGCLDSRAARRYVSEIAWRLGVPYIDAGVEPSTLLARVNVYVPGPAAACLQCAWTQRDYDLQEQEYPCGVAGPAPATDGPSTLGALAAALQAIECQKLLGGDVEHVLVGREVLIDAAHHTHYVSQMRSRNGDCRDRCRFDHNTWDIETAGRMDGEITIGQALDLAHAAGEANGTVRLRVEGEAFVTELTCMQCGAKRPLLRLSRRLTRSQRTCPGPGCGKEMTGPASGKLDALDRQHLDPRRLGWSLRRVGLRDGDIVTVCSENEHCVYEITADGL